MKYPWAMATIVGLLLTVSSGAAGAQSDPPPEPDSRPPSSLEPDEHRAHIQNKVREVLDRPAFRRQRAREQGWFDWIADRIGRGLRSLGEGIWALPALAVWILIVGLVLILALLLVHMILTMTKMYRSVRAYGREMNHTDTGALLGIRDLDLDSVYPEARKLLADGQWTEAVRYFYVAGILALDRRGRITFRTNKTNYDYLRELRRQPNDYERMRWLTRCFEAHAYGGVPATQRSAGQVAELVQAMHDEATAAQSK